MNMTMSSMRAVLALGAALHILPRPVRRSRSWSVVVFLMANAMSSAALGALDVDLDSSQTGVVTGPTSVTIRSLAVETTDQRRIASHRIIHNGETIASATPDQDTSTLEVTVPLPIGVHTFHARAVSSSGETRQSVSRVVDVRAGGHLPPTVSLSAPAGAPFIAPATVMLSAAASDPDGTVTSVEFLKDGEVIGTDTAAPYAYAWIGAAAGAYVLAARATDNSGNIGTSAGHALVVGSSQIVGNVDGVYLGADGTYRIGGWACSTGRNDPIDVHLWVGGPAGAPGASSVLAATANLGSEPAVAAACNANGIAYRYAIPLSMPVRQLHANKSIYIHGISPIAGGSNFAVNNSGVFTIPAPISVTRRYIYDEHQRLCRSIEPETRSTVHAYDQGGNVAWTAAGLDLPDDGQCHRGTAEQSGRRVDRSYDARDRLKTLAFPDGRGDQSWSYTPDGLPSTVETRNLVGVITTRNRYVYNKRRLLEEEWQGQGAWYDFKIDYGYDANAHVATLTYPTGLVVNFAPNALGQQTKAGSFATGVTYHPNGAIASFVYGNGVRHRMVTNGRGLPERVWSQKPGSPAVHDDSYDYDPNGNVQAISDGLEGHRGDRTMTYDGLDRLLLVTSPMYAASGGETYYRYDGLDNLTETKAPGRDHYYCYDARWHLTNVKVGGCGGTSVSGLSYDVQGNLANRDGQVYDFDFGNRLREVMGVERHRYDAHGRRVLSMNFGQGIVFSTYAQDGKVYYQRNERPGEHKNIDHIYLGGSLVAQREVPTGGGAAVVKYQHTDALGSPVVVTNQAGGVLERVEYEPYGRSLAASASTGNNRPGYTGHVEDRATGLTYMQQRYYDPQLGRLVSADPVSTHPSSGSNFNRFKYAANNPYIFIDPDGRQEREQRDRRSITAKSPSAAWRMTASASSPSNRSGQNQRASRIKYNSEPPVTVPPHGDNAQALQCTANCVGADELLVTGGAEQSGHSRNSAHYSNRAVDVVGKPFNQIEHRDVIWCARACGYTHGGWEVEGRFYPRGDARSSVYKDHWHLQLGGSGRVPPLPKGQVYSSDYFTRSPTMRGGMIGP